MHLSVLLMFVAAGLLAIVAGYMLFGGFQKPIRGQFYMAAMPFVLSIVCFFLAIARMS